MHPPFTRFGGNTKLSYRLDKQYAEFKAEVSLNDGPEESETPLTFAVYGDGKLLWNSPKVTSQADAAKCQVSLKDVAVLTLEVQCPGHPHGAHAVWIEPVLFK